MKKKSLVWVEDLDNLVSECGKYVIAPVTWYPSGDPETYMVEYFFKGTGFKLPGACYSQAAAKIAAERHLMG